MYAPLYVLLVGSAAHPTPPLVPPVDEEDDVPPEETVPDDPTPPDDDEEDDPPEQSESLAVEQPVGQHPSPPLHCVMGLCPHARLQVAALPVAVSTVHALLSLQLAAQLPSQVSPRSTWLFPHVEEQSLSVALVHPAGQQPSLRRQVTMGW